MIKFNKYQLILVECLKQDLEDNEEMDYGYYNCMKTNLSALFNLIRISSYEDYIQVVSKNKGSIISYLDTVLQELEVKKIYKKRKKKIQSSGGTQVYEITYPGGEVRTIENLSEFCRNKELTLKSMQKVSRGALKTHKGYRCQKVRRGWLGWTLSYS